MIPGAAVLYAVILGVNASPAPDVPPLRYADDDAVAYARLFRDAGAHTTLLTTLDADSRVLHADAHPDGPATRKSLLDALAAFDAAAAGSDGESDLYLVYSGHGDVDHGEGFVMLDGERLTRSQLYDQLLARTRATRVHLIVDSCKSYYMAYARGETGERRRHDAPFVDDKMPARLPRVGFVLSTSSDAESHEWDDYQGGVFSHEVQSALRGAADADGDGSVSYAELGAFIRGANLGISNPRFRPRVTVTPPAGSATDGQTTLLSWISHAREPLAQSSAARPATMALAVDVPALGHFSVEDEAGRRLVDANLGPGTNLLHLPAVALFVATSTEEFSVAAPSGPSPLRLSAIASHPRNVATRGALNQAFGHLFQVAFDRASVEDYLAHPDPPALDTDDEPRLARRRLRIAAATLALASLTAGLGATFGALAIHDAAAGASQDQILVANDRIAALNATAIGLYAVGGVSAIGWAILSRWPKSDHQITGKTTVITAAPGPGDVGLSLAARWP